MHKNKAPLPPLAGTEHLVFICHSSRIVGVERSTVALVREARLQGARVTVVLPKRGPMIDLLTEIDGVVIKYYKAQWWMGRDHTGLKGLLKLIQSLLQTFMWWPRIARLRPTTVYIMSTVTPAPMLASKLGRFPLVIFFSESIRTNPDYHSVMPKSVIIAFLGKWATVTLAHSDYSARQYGGASLIEPPDIGNSDTYATLSRSPGRRKTLRKLVMLGTLSAEKGQIDAVRAVGIARDRGAPITLDLYGDADPLELDALLLLIHSLGLDGVVRHLGVTNAPLEVLQSADLSLVCSRNEAYGRVTVESLAVGTPVVGYRAGGTAEILAEGGGIAVDVSVTDLAATLIALTADQDKFNALVAEAGQRAASRRGFGDAGRTVRRIKELIAQNAYPPSEPSQ